jgi:hypothetical protein
MSERDVRIGTNEAIFRSVNEQVRGLNVTLATFTETMMIVCECGERGCIEQIAIAPDAYARVREDPACFVVLPGHELPDTEDVVSREAGYFLVRKKPGLPEAIARVTDTASP